VHECQDQLPLDILDLIIDKNPSIINRISVTSTKYTDVGIKPALINAVQQANVTAVKYLLQKGACVDIKDNSLDTALSWAVYKGHNTIAKILIKAGADIENKNIRGNTPICEAYISCQTDSIKLLLQHGADPNVTPTRNNSNCMELMDALSSINKPVWSECRQIITEYRKKWVDQIKQTNESGDVSPLEIGGLVNIIAEYALYDSSCLREKITC
jgi:ankyrin repeat protein